MGATTSADPSCSTPWSAPSSGTTSACCARPMPGRPATTCARAATTAPSCASSAWAGRPTTGTPWPRRSSSPRTSSPIRGSASSTGAAASRISSGPVCSSRSATRRGVPSPSAGASCRPARARRRRTGPSPSTRTRRSRRSTRSAVPSTRSTGPRTASLRRARSSCARATPTSSASSRPACPGPSPPVAPRWPRSTSPCCGISPSASCWPTTPTRPARAPPHGSTNGSASTRSTWWWRTCPAAATPVSWPGTDPTALARAVKEARPFLQFRVDRMLQAGDLTTAEGRARAADAALTAVAEHPDDLVRDQYVMQLADRCRVDPVKLRERLEHLRANPPAEKPARRNRGSQDEPPPRDYPRGRRRPAPAARRQEWFGCCAALRPGPGLEALKLAVHRPEDVVDRVHAVLFTDRVQRQAFVALLEHDSVHEAVETASPEVASLLRRVIVEEPMSGDPELGDPVDSVVVVMLRDAGETRARRHQDAVAGERRLLGGSGRGVSPSGALAGRTRGIRLRSRRCRPIGSVVGSEATRGVTTLAGRR